VTKFPAVKSKRFFKILKGLGYEVKRQNGSHRVMTAPGRKPLVFAFHDGATVPPGLVRKVLMDEVGLAEDEALELL